MKSCDRSQILFKTLFNSGNVEDQFEKIIEDCKRKNTKYKDPDFYPQKSLIEEDKEILQENEWRRIEDQYPSNIYENISEESIQQGKLGDCYLVVSFIYASRHPELVKTLFHPQSSLQYGCVLVYFYFLGERLPVIIDTQIAYQNSDSKNPLFCHPKSNNDSCWFVLVEKAFAKACGGYNFIISGSSHIAMRLLFDYFSSSQAKIENLIPKKSLKEEKEKVQNLNEKIFDFLTKLLEKKSMIGTHISEKNSSKINNEDIGLMSEHAYQIIDVRKSENKNFIKLRNPWGIGKYNGYYSKDSKSWTIKLKNDLNYNEKEDGSFWMLLDNYFYYFDSVCFSLQREKDWKEMSVCGKIEGYLDGRSPCTGDAHVGCIPQWSIKFTKKTVVRLSYDVSSPESFYSIYIVKNKGRKVDFILEDTEIERTPASNTNVNGIEYIVEDYREPFTFFFNRTDKREEPCYFRILIQSPDSNFTVKKFDDNFITEKWNCKSATGFFNCSEMDKWNPYGSRPLTTCRQWFIKFPKLEKNEETELRFRIFKDVSEGPLNLLFSRTDERISYSYSTLQYSHFIIESVSNYEEFSITINQNYLNLLDEDKPFNYVFSIYRNEQTDVNKFKFFVLSKKEFEFGLMKQPDPIHNCCYSISGDLNNDDNDGASPYEIKKPLKSMKQWCLIFKKSPVTLFVEFLGKSVLSIHHVYLEIRDKPGKKINCFYENTIHYDFNIEEGCEHDQAIWEITDISKPYSLCVTRNKADSMSSFKLNIFGTDEFEMYEINDDESIGEKANQFNYIKDYYYYTKENYFIDFPEVDFVEQPENFKPLKSNRLYQSDQNSNDEKENVDNYIIENHKFHTFVVKSDSDYSSGDNENPTVFIKRLRSDEKLDLNVKKNEQKPNSNEDENKKSPENDENNNANVKDSESSVQIEVDLVLSDDDETSKDNNKPKEDELSQNNKKEDDNRLNDDAKPKEDESSKSDNKSEDNIKKEDDNQLNDDAKQETNESSKSSNAMLDENESSKSNIAMLDESESSVGDIILEENDELSNDIIILDENESSSSNVKPKNDKVSSDNFTQEDNESPKDEIHPENDESQKDNIVSDNDEPPKDSIMIGDDELPNDNIETGDDEPPKDNIKLDNNEPSKDNIETGDGELPKDNIVSDNDEPPKDSIEQEKIEPSNDNVKPETDEPPKDIIKPEDNEGQNDNENDANKDQTVINDKQEPEMKKHKKRKTRKQKNTNEPASTNNADAVPASNKENDTEIIQKLKKQSSLKKMKSYLVKHNIPFTCVIKIITLDNKTNKKQFFVLSDFNFIIMKRESRRITNCYTESLLNVSSISLGISNIIIIYLKHNSVIEKVELQTKCPNLFIESFNDQIKRLLTSFEIKNIYFDNFVIPKSLFKCTPQNILFRFNSLMKMNNIKTSQKFLDRTTFSIYSNSNSYTFLKIKKRKTIFPILFQSVLLNRRINEIKIDKPDHIYYLIFEYIEYFENICHVIVEGPVTNDLIAFIRKSKNINSLSFSNHLIDNFYSISLLIENDRIHSIGFDSSIDEKGLSNFITLPSFRKLSYFRISNVTNINFASCVNYFTNLTVLSLKSCNLCIGKVFETMNCFQFNYLKELDLSGNIGTGFPLTKEHKFTLFNQLKTLFVNDVQWDIENLIFFMNLCSESSLSLLSINNIMFINSNKEEKKINLDLFHKKYKVENEQDEWINLFNNLPNGMNSISELNWNSNKIDSKLIDFLLNSKKLSHVSFSSCNILNLPYIKRLLINSQIQSVIISKLSIDKENSELIQFKEFLSEISNMKSLRQILISKNNLDNECFEIMANSLINSNVGFISFDGSNVKSSTDLFNFFEALKKSKRKPIQISFPIRDVHRLKMNQNEIDLVNRYLYILTKPLDRRRKLSPYSIMPEYSIPKMKRKFPQFLSKKYLLNDQKDRTKKPQTRQNNYNEMPLLDTTSYISDVNIEFAERKIQKFTKPTKVVSTQTNIENSKNENKEKIKPKEEQKPNKPKPQPKKTPQKKPNVPDNPKSQPKKEEKPKPEPKQDKEEEKPKPKPDQKEKQVDKKQQKETKQIDEDDYSYSYSSSYSYSDYSYSLNKQENVYFTGLYYEDLEPMSKTMTINKNKTIIFVDKKTIISKVDIKKRKKYDSIYSNSKQKQND